MKRKSTARHHHQLAPSPSHPSLDKGHSLLPTPSPCEASQHTHTHQANIRMVHEIDIELHCSHFSSSSWEGEGEGLSDGRTLCSRLTQQDLPCPPILPPKHLSLYPHTYLGRLVDGRRQLYVPAGHDCPPCVMCEGRKRGRSHEKISTSTFAPWLDRVVVFVVLLPPIHPASTPEKLVRNSRCARRCPNREASASTEEGEACKADGPKRKKPTKIPAAGDDLCFGGDSDWTSPENPPVFAQDHHHLHSVEPQKVPCKCTAWGGRRRGPKRRGGRAALLVGGCIKHHARSHPRTYLLRCCEC